MRDLYQCLNAIYPNLEREYVWCEKEHKLGDGRIRGEQVKLGKPLVFQRCQGCKDFTNEPEWEGEKGWKGY